MLYPHAIWKGAAWENYSTTPIKPTLGVLHVAQGSEAGIDPWFHDPKALVSAHLFNPKVGPMEQFVDLLMEAYAECAYNGKAISVEHEGFSGERLTKGQAIRIRQAFVFFHEHPQFRIPYRWRDNGFSGPGWTSHGDLGVEGGDHPQCPGDGIVADARAILIELANASRLLKW